MKAKTNYMIAPGDTLSHLKQNVELSIAVGFIPCGGPFEAEGKFFQAMVRASVMDPTAKKTWAGGPL